MVPTATNAPHLEVMHQSIPLIQLLVVSFILTIRSEYFLQDDIEVRLVKMEGDTTVRACFLRIRLVASLTFDRSTTTFFILATKFALC